MLAEGGDFAGAAELMEQALELAPIGRPAGSAWPNMRRSLRTEGGGCGWRQWPRWHPRRMTVRREAEACGARRPPTFPATPPSRYVQQLFDDYAQRFDKPLVEQARLQRAAETGRAGRRGHRDSARFFQRDRPRLRHRASSATRVRDRAHIARRLRPLRQDAGQGAGESGLRSARPGGSFAARRKKAAHLRYRPARRISADLASAADVLIYLGELAPFSIAARSGRAGRPLSFSVEDAGSGGDYVPASVAALRPWRRLCARPARRQPDLTVLLEPGKPSSAMDAGSPRLPDGSTSPDAANRGRALPPPDAALPPPCICWSAISEQRTFCSGDVD